MKVAIAGILTGVGLLAGGALVFLYGLGQPPVYGCFGDALCAWGNVPYWMGIILMLAGLAVLGGILEVKLGMWNRESKLPDD